MNKYTIELTSTTSEHTQILPEVSLSDHTELSIDLNGVDEKILPIYVTIDWGDGNRESHDNNVYIQGRENINIFKQNPVLSNIYTNQYYPSETALYRSLSAQVLIYYANGQKAWFICPISIRTYDYFESIGDIEIINTNLLPVNDNGIEYQLKTSEGHFTLELNT